MSKLENYFEKFRENIVGINQTFQSGENEMKIIYADWIASGRLYKPIEDYITNTLGPYVANTHTETTVTGTTMTDAYHQAQIIIKKHVNANENDALISAGFGMTAVVNKFQRILGLKAPKEVREHLKEEDKPVVIITHMEHHSNQTSWLECACDLEIIQPDENGLPDLNDLERILIKYKSRKRIIGAFSACSNVTGIFTPIHDMAKLMHKYNGYCFADYAASAPYTEMNMHPEDQTAQLDAILFSPHKFLGGPGSSGILIFNKDLYNNEVPDHPGGGTVKWTNPWGGHSYFDDIEAREDGGTPGFLQTIKVALAIKLKEQMGTKNLMAREHELIEIIKSRLSSKTEINILEPKNLNRLSVFSFYVNDIHYNLFVKLLNDNYGIQTRGGCSCAGTYGHILLHVDQNTSDQITNEIETGNMSHKPGWVRLSLHPTMTNKEVHYICDSIIDIVDKYKDMEKFYNYDMESGEFVHKTNRPFKIDISQTFNVC